MEQANYEALEEGAQLSAIWIKTECADEGLLLAGEDAQRVWGLIQTAVGSKPPSIFWFGELIIAYRTSTDQPWTTLQ